VPEVVRMCLGCRTRRPVSELMRLCLRDGALLIDAPGGRGAWVCRHEPTCVERALVGKRLERALRSPVAPKEIDRARALLLGDSGQEQTL